MRVWIVGMLAAGLSACGANSANMRIGDQQTYESLADQREAARAISVSAAVPAGAAILGPITASRCHRNALDSAPTNNDVIADLRISAFAQGADGIADVRIEKNSGSALLKNCWHTLVGTATMYRSR